MAAVGSAADGMTAGGALQSADATADEKTTATTTTIRQRSTTGAIASEACRQSHTDVDAATAAATAGERGKNQTTAMHFRYYPHHCAEGTGASEDAQ